MRNNVRTDLSRSARAFVDLVWPAIKHLARNGEILPVEGSTTYDLKHSLDVLAGIDAWQICRDQSLMRGIASRVQCYNFDTFTIRYRRDSGAETEYEKRLRAIGDPGGGWLLPHLTIQAYVTDQSYTSLRVAAIVRTLDLFQYVVSNRDDKKAVWEQHTKNKGDDGAQFLAVPWSVMRERGVSVGVWPKPEIVRHAWLTSTSARGTTEA